MASEDTSLPASPASPANPPTTSDSLGVPKQRFVSVGGSNGDSKPVAQIRTASGSVRDMIAKFERNATPIAPPDKGLAGAGNQVPGRVRSWGKVDVKKKDDPPVAKDGNDALSSTAVEKQELPKQETPKQDAPKQEVKSIERTESAAKKLDDDAKITGDGDDVTKTTDSATEGASVVKLEGHSGTGAKDAGDSNDDGVQDEPVTAIEDEREQTPEHTERDTEESAKEEPARDNKEPENQGVDSVESKTETEEPDEALEPTSKESIVDNAAMPVPKDEEKKSSCDEVPDIGSPIDPANSSPKLEEPETNAPTEPDEPTVPPPTVNKPSETISDPVEEETNDQPRANDRDPASVETF